MFIHHFIIILKKIITKKGEKAQIFHNKVKWQELHAFITNMTVKLSPASPVLALWDAGKGVSIIALQELPAEVASSHKKLYYYVYTVIYCYVYTVI